MKDDDESDGQVDYLGVVLVVESETDESQGLIVLAGPAVKDVNDEQIPHDEDG